MRHLILWVQIPCSVSITACFDVCCDFSFCNGVCFRIKNRNARSVDYAFKNPSTSSSWMSRNMIISGLTVLAFLVLHFVDFWIPEN